ncbi:MAG: NAD(P)H-dependent oxidoreductase [Salana multivorans]|uniref:NADPH-dependent FMN reductase n=1 Tax=Salana multivorans TaxID=120377 RepID=UPI00095AFFDA|nr:NAD(P)H-dependent oxidoreductase [Salana multivorans]MBN8883625.1 NAD(P)H-dependent oxidoreductase [Salana multivorans]OJX95429.1 MAG: hypothetical protein BGO96_11395 [Micrococcales bacterium 73-15]
MSILVLSGNPRPASRTSAVATDLARELAGPLGLGEIDVVELADIAAEVLVGGAGLAAARARVLAARLVVVATPVYKGSYTGLLKSFLDTFDGGELSGVTAVGVVVAGQDGHLHAGESHLRPVLLELGARVPAPAVALAQRDVAERGPVLASWARRNLASLRGALDDASRDATPGVAP